MKILLNKIKETQILRLVINYIELPRTFAPYNWEF